ncbi:unnamed protein product [Hyaloperonospora brassicae]|uniref:Uncharacterized protein n=1 Tax=Hyaloperonospora brassicae TaxID=162125 RepID=A0AAV0T641_HYABA|nr:unnamed protein product [Hyaloperonospora brassicae]
MKFSSGLVLAAVAVTAAHAGNSNSLRTTEATPIEHDFQSTVVARDPVNGREIKVKDLAVDLEQIFGKSKDGIPTKFNILDLIGSGNGQADLKVLAKSFNDGENKDNSYDTKEGKLWKEDGLVWLDAYDDDMASAAADKTATKGAAVSNGDDDNFTSSKDLKWIEDDSVAGSRDVVGVKSATKGYAESGKGDASGSDDLAWLFDDEAGSNTFADMKGDSQGAAPFVVGKDSVGGKGDDKGAFVIGGDDNDEVDDAVASKASKASKKGGDNITFSNLYDEGSNGLVGGEGPLDNKDTIAVASATKGKALSAKDDDKSIANEAVQNDVVQSDETVGGDNVATKGTK